MTVLIEDIVTNVIVQVDEPISENITVIAEEVVTVVTVKIAEAPYVITKKIYEIGDIQVFKTKPKTNIDYEEGQQIGDWCVGFVYTPLGALRFINAEYTGGDILLDTSYDV